MKKYSFILFVAIAAISCKRGPDPEITVAELRAHVEYMASESLEGRYPGTAGDSLAAVYIRKQFSACKLQLLGDNGFQSFDILLGKEPGPDNRLSFKETTGIPGKDFNPAPFSSTGVLESGLVFAGYGFDMDYRGKRWNDYKAVDISKKWVMLLRGDPDWNNPASEFAAYSDDRDKAMLAMDKGAAGVLLVSGPVVDPSGGLPESDYRQGEVGIPVFYITRDLADTLLAITGDSTGGMESILNQEKKACSMEIPLFITGFAEIKEIRSASRNVLAFLEGNDPDRRNEILVVGAHYDHLGMGGKGSGSRRPDTLAVHPGADDNASGVAAVLELACKLADIRDSLKISILFAAFGAEEMGLIGSRYFIDHPVVPIEHIKGMLNLDMIGRLKEENLVQVGGTGSSAEADSLLAIINTAEAFGLSFSPEGYGPSDHASFYANDIPVLFFSTGPHLDYHTPFDIPGKLEYDGLKEITVFVCHLVRLIDNMSSPLTFREAGPKTSASMGRRRGGVSLGIMPDFAGVVKDGLRADFVIEGRPAAIAGMQNGDIIVAINGLPVKNIHDYMFRLSGLKPGHTANVEVLRGEERKVFLIQL